MTTPSTAYQEFKKHMQKVADLNFSESVLSWDQQTYMPKNGARFRAQQMSTLKTLAHEFFVIPHFGALMSDLIHDQKLSEDERRNVELTYSDYQKKKKYPKKFVEEFSQLCGESFSAWDVAKKTNQFTYFEPYLKRLVEFKKQEAEFLGYEAHPYEALMDDYEPGLTVKKVDEVFTDVKTQLFPFIKQVLNKKRVESNILTQHYPKAQQWAVTETLLKQMGYNFDSGRADYTSHPFSTTFAPGDSRITLWVDEKFLSAMIFAGIHEAGHALYEMGVPLEQHYGLPLGQALSMAFHESQSRLWENNIGRSRAFWKSNFALLQNEFPSQLKAVSTEQFYSAINEVSPTLIRVEADELTYHAHVYIRYLIEKALIEGQIQVKDIPAFWSERYKEYLGVAPKTDTEGCLQDVHWSYGAFGYFPTYSLGSFYSAQLMAQMKTENPELERQIEGGDTSYVLNWLRNKIHAHGRKYNSADLLTRTTGSDLKFSYFMDYARKKYGELYGI